MVIRVEQYARFEAIPSIIHGTPQYDPLYQFKTGQEWRVECRKIPRLSVSLDHYSSPHYNHVNLPSIYEICIFRLANVIVSDGRKIPSENMNAASDYYYIKCRLNLSACLHAVAVCLLWIKWRGGCCDILICLGSSSFVVKRKPFPYMLLLATVIVM